MNDTLEAVAARRAIFDDEKISFFGVSLDTRDETEKRAVDIIPGIRHFWDAAIRVDPAAAEADAGKRFTICHPDNLRSLFEDAGLQAVEVIPIDINTRFADFDDYWLPFLGAQGSVAKYLRSMSDETRTAVRDQLQRQLPTGADGSISLVARAWAVKGQKAG